MPLSEHEWRRMYESQLKQENTVQAISAQVNHIAHTQDDHGRRLLQIEMESNNAKVAAEALAKRNKFWVKVAMGFATIIPALIALWEVFKANRKP